MKKYISYNIKYAWVMLFALLSVSCNDMLDRRPLGVATDASDDGMVFGMYVKMRAFGMTSGTTALAIHGMRSEDAEKGSTASDGADQGRFFDEFEYNASNGMLGEYWTANYSLIHSANDLLADLDARNEDLSANSLVNKGEAHFFRALAYFNLVRAFGNIPKIDFRIKNNQDANIPQSSPAEIYALIDSDLAEAERYLPYTWESRFVGRLTWGAARALHAKTYMTRNDWGNMNAAANEVINSHLYNLDTPYDRIFRESGENSSESVFEIQCTVTAADPQSDKYGSLFSNVQSVRGSGIWNLGWGWHTPTKLMAEAFEEGDPRKDETLLYFVRTGEDPNTIPANTPWGERPIANADVVAHYFNKKVYTDPSIRNLYARNGVWVNIRMIRYADVVLMAAESAAELGKTQEALDNLELVRARARGGNNKVLPKVTTTDKTELIDAIRHERRVELGMEFDRFYDLVRWGIAKKVLHAAGKTNYQDKHALLPIPQVEIDKSKGVLVQNPNFR